MFAMRLYRKPLKFEVEETGAKLDFVDKEIILGWDEVHVARKDPNKKFVMGTEAVPPKVRYPPYLGAAFVRKRKLKSWLMGTWFAETTADDIDRQKLGAIRVVAELQIQESAVDIGAMNFYAEVASQPGITLQTLKPLLAARELSLRGDNTATLIQRFENDLLLLGK